MQKTLIVLVVGLLAVGCGKTEEELEEIKQKQQEALKDSVVGEYEYSYTTKYENQYTYKRVFSIGSVQESLQGVKGSPYPWSIVNGEIHTNFDAFKKRLRGDDGKLLYSRVDGVEICRINEDKSITTIGVIKMGKRTNFSEKYQRTFKKIK